MEPLSKAYPTFKGLSLYSHIDFDSYVFQELTSQELVVERLLDTTRHLLVPTAIPLKFLVTSNDVLHAFSLLQVGMKVDAVPGRLNGLALFLLTEGLVHGMCSELCGSGHFSMPIFIECIDEALFYWVNAFNLFSN